MHSKFDVQFEGSLDEFNAWASRVFKDHGNLRVKVQVLALGPTINDPLVHAVAETFRREITADVACAIRDLVTEGKRIEALKTFRVATGLSLPDAKHFLDANFPHDKFPAK